MAFFPSLISFSSLPAIDNLEINPKISSLTLTLFYSATFEYPQQINMGQIKIEPTENIKPDPICNGAYILPLDAPTVFFWFSFQSKSFPALSITLPRLLPDDIPSSRSHTHQTVPPAAKHPETARISSPGTPTVTSADHTTFVNHAKWHEGGYGSHGMIGEGSMPIIRNAIVAWLVDGIGLVQNAPRRGASFGLVR